MSYVFDIGDETVWSPALRVGEIYVGTLNAVGAAFQLPTGLNAIASDMYEIDVNVFEKLVLNIFDTYFSTGNEVLRRLIDGVLAPSVVILERGNRAVAPKGDAQAAYLARAAGLSMPK